MLASRQFWKLKSDEAAALPKGVGWKGEVELCFSID